MQKLLWKMWNVKPYIDTIQLHLNAIYSIIRVSLDCLVFYKTANWVQKNDTK